jgi:hypothetical protein
MTATDDGHEHRWSDWSDWKYGGYQTDMRTRDCGDHADPEYRPHRHDWKQRPDPFAPVGSGLTLQVCSGPCGCGDTK